MIAALLLAATVQAVLLDPVPGADDVNIRRVQPVDAAAWIWAETPSDTCLFRRRFTSGKETVRVHVSADNRYLLKLDGARIARGPERGTVDRWTYRTLDLGLEAGEHVLEAVVHRGGAPLAQLEWERSGGFILKAEGALDAALTTGVADWRVRTFDTVKDLPGLPEAFGVGCANEVRGDSPWTANPPDAAFAPVRIVREAVGTNETYGTSLPGWRLHPTGLPPQLAVRKRPGAIRAVAHTADPAHVFTAGEAGGDFPSVIPARTARTYLWDLGDYFCAYPELAVTGGTGARIEWSWAESLQDARTKLKGDRDAFAGKFLYGFTDVFLPTGGDAGFTAKWWRAGRWVRLAVRTADEPLTIRDLAITETRYPTPYTGAFTCDDASLPPVLRLMERTLQMCTHEMSFDCPYYEQQMYPGDTRLQLLVHGVLSADDRLAKRDLELYDELRRPNGLIGFNFPTSKRQDGAAYTLIYPLMLADYARWRADRPWLKRRLPGLLHVMEGLRAFENGDALVANLPGWNFQDWSQWPDEGCPAGSHEARGTNCINNLLYVYALDAAASVADALGEKGFADVYRARAAQTRAGVEKVFWDETRGMLADDTAHASFSEHAQALAVVLGVTSGARRERLVRNLLENPALVRTTVYFSHYLFEAYAKLGRTDLILKRLDLWRGYLKKGLRTAQESPDEMRYGLAESRSDCHAWGAHPIYHLHAHVLGLRPAAPFFGAVRIAPQPGGLKRLRTVTPSPKGDIRCELEFDGDGAHGHVRLPVGLSGEFVYGQMKQVLVPGENVLP